MLNSSSIKAYNDTRPRNVRHLLCHAPSVNINFEQNGNMTACCYNRKHVLGTYPAQTIEEAWQGQKAEELRTYISQSDLGGGCSACEHILNSGNFSGSKAKYYDEYADTSQSFTTGLIKIFEKDKLPQPKVFEFEIDNTCNLECIMCSGYYSSSIRKNREKLPALHNPYDEEFVNQVADFLPGITDLKYLGGEPFMTELYLKIWERVAQINPSIRNHITTNGTILNSRIKALLENMQAGFILSIDSVNKSTYEKIRQGASFDKVMDNLDYFLDYARRKNSYVSMAVCPMTANAEEMPELIHFANQRGMRVHFNTVTSPDYLSLRFADSKRLQHLIELYTAERISENEIADSNYKTLREFSNQLKFWCDKDRQDQTKPDDRFNAFPNEIFIPVTATLLTRHILHAVKQYYISNSNEMVYHDALYHLLSESNMADFINSYFEAMIILQQNMMGDKEGFYKKIDGIRTTALQLPNKALMATELIHTGILYQISYFMQETYEQATGSLIARYS